MPNSSSKSTALPMRKPLFKLFLPKLDFSPLNLADVSSSASTTSISHRTMGTCWEQGCVALRMSTTMGRGLEASVRLDRPHADAQPNLVFTFINFKLGDLQSFGGRLGAPPVPLAAEDDEAAVRQQRHLESLPSAALRAARLLPHSMKGEEVVMEKASPPQYEHPYLNMSPPFNLTASTSSCPQDFCFVACLSKLKCKRPVAGQHHLLCVCKVGAHSQSSINLHLRKKS
ncbi:hypothetical protein LUU34_00484200 [Aix galericulata]|nr:hypothetical protein LUU34_00484200 [Aix galericulata]